MNTQNTSIINSPMTGAPTRKAGAMTMITNGRRFNSGIVAAGFSATAGSSVGRLISVFAQEPAVPTSGLIDVHHHIVPPFYLSENRDWIVADSTRVIQNAVVAGTIAQIQTDRQTLLGKISNLLRRRAANLLHCRSPYLLCLKHVDNLGGYSIPPGDGPLIPSVFNSYL
jgi:hypothetical protein